MTYLDELATEIRRHVPSRLLPTGDLHLLFRLYALLALSKGHAVTVEDVHNAWAVWMLQHDPDHRALEPFAALDADTQAADEPFLEAIRAVVAQRPVNVSA